MFNEMNLSDIFKSEYLLLALIPIFLFITPANCTEIHKAQRLTQFDVNSVQYGSRLANINFEVKSLFSWSTNRHCVLTRLQELTSDKFIEINKKAGGLVILLPANFTLLNSEDKNNIYSVEKLMLSQVTIPVYFIEFNDVLDKIIEEIDQSGYETKTGAAVNDIMNLISSNGYQLVTSGISNNANKKQKITIIEGDLLFYKTTKNQNNVDIPNIIITANLNTFGIMNKYQYNSESALLFTIMDFFSKLYNNQYTSPKYNIKFILFESGHLLNYQGTKRWLDDNLQIQNIEFVLCLDTLIQQTVLDTENKLFMHVSKPPKELSSVGKFFKQLKLVADSENVTAEGIHKKINLADPQLAWEHEKFGIKKITAFTLSAVRNFQSQSRNTLFTENELTIQNSFKTYAKIIVETLGKYIYDMSEGDDIFEKFINIDDKVIDLWTTTKSASSNNDIKYIFEKYLKNVKVTHEKPENRDPEFMFYHGTEATLNIYNVKPAVFDLFLTLLISAYLFSIYFAVSKFGSFFTFLNDYSQNKID